MMPTERETYTYRFILFFFSNNDSRIDDEIFTTVRIRVQ